MAARRSGPHGSMRSAVRAVIAAQRFRLDPSAKRQYAKDQQVSAEAICTLDEDLQRTACDEPLVDARRGMLRAILLRQLAEDPQLGYCQGMNLVAAVFAAAAGSQGEAFERFHAFVRQVRGLWLPGFPLLAEGTERFVLSARDRGWYQHLSAHGVEPSMFLPQALMTMLAMWLPMPTITQCLGLPERHGLDGMLAMTLSLLDRAQGRLLKERDMEGLLHVLNNLRDVAPQPNVLESAAHKILQGEAQPDPPLLPLFRIRNPDGVGPELDPCTPTDAGVCDTYLERAYSVASGGWFARGARWSEGPATAAAHEGWGHCRTPGSRRARDRRRGSRGTLYLGCLNF